MHNPFQLMENRFDKLENLVSDLKETINKQSTHQPQLDELLTPKEACEVLKISISTLWRYEKEGKLKVYGLGGNRYLKRSELLDSLTLKEKEL